MNKDKLIKAKKVVMHEIGQALEKANKHELNFNIQMMIASVLGDLTATLDDKLDEIIQSEPEETKPIEIEGIKTCTYTKEKVAELILEYALDLENSKNFACDMETDDVLYWLNEKEGE